MSTETINKVMIQEFSSDLHMLAQKMSGVLYPIFRPVKADKKNGTMYPKMSPFDLYDATDERHTSTKTDFAQYDSIWATPRKGRQALYVDGDDDFDLAFKPGSHIMRNGAMAINRFMDRVAYDAFNATFKTGREQNGTEALSSDIVADGGNKIPLDSTANGSTDGVVTGFSIDKLLAARLFFSERNVPSEEQIYCVLSRYELNQLLIDSRTSSSDHSVVKALYNGEIDNYAGIKFIVFNAPLDGVPGEPTQKHVYFFTAEGMGFDHVRTFVEVEQIATKNYDWQFYFQVICSSLRFDTDRVCYALVDRASVLDTGVEDLE